MFRKINTIKARITILSLLVVIATVSSIVLTDYVLQSVVNSQLVELSDVMIATGIEGGQTSKDLTDKELVVGTTAIIIAKQQNKFGWLIGISSTILVIGMASIYILIKKELQPLENLRHDMDQMDFKTRDKKLLVTKSNRLEIMSLTNSYNQMIENLKESYDLQKRFSQDAAHELKTPITTMKTSLQVNQMLSPTHDEETRELIDVIEGQVERMEQLVTGLLTISNQKTLRLETVLVEQICQDIIESYKFQLEQKDISVKIEGQCELVTDQNILTIILKNLIENAIRYNNPSGSIVITLDEDIVISDTGLGISKQDQDRIFSPFYCVDESRSKTFGGLGLGLSIVRESLSQLGYTLILTSELGKGSAFHIVTSQSTEKLK